MTTSTYSFLDVSGAFSHPLTAPFIFGGEVGANQLHVTMATEKTVHDVAADAAVMVSFIAGDNGSITIEVQQTSAFHQFLLAWYNIIKTLAMAGNVTNWATASITVRALVDGSVHVLTGVSPSKNPDKVYAAQGQKITWTLMAADIQTITL